MKNLALKRIQKMSPYKPPLLDRRVYKGLLLDFNERTLVPGSKVRKSLKRTSKQEVQIYPEYDELEKLVAKYAGVKPDQVMLTNGSDQAGEVIFRTFTEKDSKVIAPTPSFDMYFQNAGVLGNKVASPLYEGPKLDFPLEKLLKEIDKKTKLVIVCNPNSPTGSLVPLKNIEKIAKAAKNSIVYVDEAYFEFSGVTAVPLIKKYPNVVVSLTFSKAFGLAALRIGYVIADKSYISEMLKVRSPYPVNMAAVSAAVAALKNPAYMKRYVKKVNKRSKPLVKDFFRKNGIKFYASEANFILFKPDNPGQVYKKLASSGVLLRPQNKPGIKNSLRLTLGTPKQMKKFCEIYEKELL